MAFSLFANTESRTNGGSRVLSFLFLCGIVTKANGIFLALNQEWFGLDYTKTMLAPLFFFFASVFIAPFAGAALHRFGFKSGMLSGVAICIFSSLFMFAAHYFHLYSVFLFGIFMLGIGVKFLLVTAPSYAVAVGPKDSESGRISMMQAFYSIGALIAPGLFWVLLSSGSFNPNSVVSFSYLAFFFFWAALVLSIAPIKIVLKKRSNKSEGGIFPKFTKTLALSFLAMFLYMGIEVSFDSLLVKLLTDVDGGGLSLSLALSCFSLYYVGITIGRFSGFWILNRFPLPLILIAHSLVALVMLSLSIWISGIMVIIAAVVLGFCNSYIYPLLLAAGVKEEKSPPSKVIGFLSTGAVGGAVLPLLQGMCADRFGLRYSFIIPFLCYVGLFFYARFMWAHQSLKDKSFSSNRLQKS